jgi:hypothetical protein
MEHAVLLSIHIAAGTAGLVLGPVAMWQATRRLEAARSPDTGASAAYHWTVLAVCPSAAVLVVWFRPELWWLVPVAAFSYSLVLLGRFAVARRFRSWMHAYAHGQGGSYSALVTALVVVAATVDGPVHGAAEVIPWTLPAVIGTPLTEWWRRRLAIRAAGEHGAPPGRRTG